MSNTHIRKLTTNSLQNGGESVEKEKSPAKKQGIDKNKIASEIKAILKRESLSISDAIHVLEMTKNNLLTTSKVQ